VLGCSAGGVIGEGRELEGTAALSLTGAVLPGVDVHPFHVAQADLPPPTADGAAWRGRLGLPDAGLDAHAIVLPDPFSCDAQRLVRGLDLAFPGGARIGGQASGGVGPGQNALFLDDAVHRAGAVGVLLTGNVTVETIVAQGCRPIGQPMFVTRGLRNVVFELDGTPVLEVLESLYESLDVDDQALFRQALFVGLVMDREREVYRQGDFLVRNLFGLDAKTGGLAIGALVEPNQVVQFHVRDARTSAEDLDAMLDRHRGESAHQRPSGALLFSCLGRGAGLYGEPDHDTRAFLARVGPVPVGGFFCNGEIGPVRGRTFVHGYTSAFGLFRPRAGYEG
jgi:small ligand-binding sensory domain FIST